MDNNVECPHKPLINWKKGGRQGLPATLVRLSGGAGFAAAGQKGHGAGGDGGQGVGGWLGYGTDG